MPVAIAPYPADLVREFTANGWWATQSLSEDVRGLAAGAHADSPAYLCAEGTLSWRDYDAAADDLAAVLRGLGLPEAEFVGVYLADSPLTHVAYLAVERAGLTIVGIGPRSGRHETAHLLATTGAPVVLTTAQVGKVDARDLVVSLRADLPALRTHLVADLVATDGRCRELTASVDPPVPATMPVGAGQPRGPNDVFMVNATSGTTGLPKCVQHSQNRWRRFAQHAVTAADLRVGEEVLFSALPSPFGFGLWSAHFLPVQLAAPCLLLHRWDAAVALQLMTRHGVTMFAGVTTQLMMLLDRLEAGTQPPPRLRAVFTGGEPVPYERARRFEELTGAAVLQFYGSNESGALSCTTVHDDVEHRLRTAGRILPEMHVGLADPHTGAAVDEPGHTGQPTCWGPLMSSGYLADEAANAALFDAEHRMRMPDLATLSADGYLTVAGRVADIIIRGGMNISAAEVEEALLAHPSVELAAVIGAPHPTFGEQVAAFVQLRHGSSLTIADVQAHFAAHGRAKHTWPEQLHVLDEMPRNTGEKIAKGSLRALL
jgi:acyl-CoA synthetase